MELAETVESKQLIKLNEKFLNIARTTNSLRNEVKALKICLKLINLEIDHIKKSKNPVDAEKLNVIFWRYSDLRNAIKFLVKTKSVQDINKCCADIENMIFVTERQIAELKGASFADGISATSQRIVNAIGDTAQKIGDAVSGKLDGLKKMLVGEENSKSE